MTDPEGNTAPLMRNIELEKPKDTMPEKEVLRGNNDVAPKALTDEDTVDTSMDRSLSSDDAESEDEGAFLQLFKVHSLSLGLVIGFFIQLSSLGANFLLSAIFGKEGHLDATKENIVVFSLGWSFLTSAMGVMILLCMRSLIFRAWSSFQSNKEEWQPIQEQLVMHMECFFAVGALIGVCFAWTCTDVVLGYKAHIYHSLLTLGAALVWCKVISHCVGVIDVEDDDKPTAISYSDDDSVNSDISNDLSKPLLSVALAPPDDERRDDRKKMCRDFKLISLAIGLLVGFFDQFSSLGANFLLNALYGGNGEEAVMKVSRHFVINFSLGWSFFTSTMSVVTLLLLRSIVLMAWSKASPKEHGKKMNSGRLALHIECFFAIGALLGVNCAWLLTDVVLGLKAHVWHSLITLVVALLWCKVITSCFGNQDDAEEETKSKDKELVSV